MFAFEPAPRPSVALTDGREFPVRRVFCIGRNYADHVVEMGGSVERHPPVFFTKPADAVRCDPGTLPYPLATTELHHEVEWVVALFGGGRHLSARAAATLVGANGVGIDFTRRDLQAAAKAAGEPWDLAKAFDDSAPISALCAGTLADVPPDTELSLAVNGTRHQSATLDHMIYAVPEILSRLSGFFELKPGDLVFTGTPAGVAAVAPGDKLVARLGAIAELSLSIGETRN